MGSGGYREYCTVQQFRTHGAFLQGSHNQRAAGNSPASIGSIPACRARNATLFVSGHSSQQVNASASGDAIPLLNTTHLLGTGAAGACGYVSASDLGGCSSVILSAFVPILKCASCEERGVLREYSTIAVLDGLSIGTILDSAYVTYKLSTEANITALLAVVGALPKGSAGESPREEFKGTSGCSHRAQGPCRVACARLWENSRNQCTPAVSACLPHRSGDGRVVASFAP